MADRRTYFNTASGVTGEFPSALAEIAPNLVEIVDEPVVEIDEPPETPAPAQQPEPNRAEASSKKEED